jgi:hypothetical protein
LLALAFARGRGAEPTGYRTRDYRATPAGLSSAHVVTTAQAEALANKAAIFAT